MVKIPDCDSGDGGSNPPFLTPIKKNEGDKMIKVIDFIDEFVDALHSQLNSDYKKYGDTWLQRFPEGQETRIRERMQIYFDQFYSDDIPVPWLKIVGLAIIGWVRETHPELWELNNAGKLLDE